jgi:glucose/arabinose dehydrogenase
VRLKKILCALCVDAARRDSESSRDGRDICAIIHEIAMYRYAITVFACAAAVMACGSKSDPPSPESGVEQIPGVEQITGNERLGWDQPASDATELASIQYVVYVDGARTVLVGVLCAGPPGVDGFACTGQLPSMSQGLHTIELAAFIDVGTVLESERSAPLRVNVVGQAATAAVTRAVGAAIVTTTDGVRLRATVVAEGLDQPTDLAFVPDGRAFVTERAGHFRVIRDGRLLREPALTLSDVIATDQNGLLAIAIDPQFERTHFVYAVYTTASGFRLARFREVNDTLGDRAILMDGIPASFARPAASLRFGPDAKLYLGLDDGGDAALGGDPGSYNGKVLRLNPDATTPADQADSTPVYALDMTSPRGLDWDSINGALWIAEADVQGRDLLQAIAIDPTGGRRAKTVARYLLPEDTGPARAVFYRGDLIPAFQGDLLIAADEGRGILRVRFDPSDPLKVASAEPLLRDMLGAVRAIAIGRDEAIYVCTACELARLVPYPTRRGEPRE